MMLVTDASSPLPLYYQIREQLKQQILSGALKPGDALPGETQICQMCGVSRMTARMALSQLANEGLVVRQRGRGTFVASPKATLNGIQLPLLSYTEMIGQLGLQAGSRILSQETVPATAVIAGHLKINPGDLVGRIARLRLINAEIMSLETSFYPNNLFPDLVHMDLTNKSIYHILEEKYGVIPNYALDVIEISTAGPYEAEALGLSEGVPVALVTRTSFQSNDTPIEFTQIVHRGDRLRSVVRRSRQQLAG